MDTPAPTAPLGLFASTQRLVATLISVVRTRVEIFSTELEEEREHLKSLLMQSVLSLMLLMLGIIAAIVFVTLWAWQWFGAYTLGAAGLLLISGGLLLALHIRQQERARPRLFATTLSELHKDIGALRHDERAA